MPKPKKAPKRKMDANEILHQMQTIKGKPHIMDSVSRITVGKQVAFTRH